MTHVAGATGVLARLAGGHGRADPRGREPREGRPARPGTAQTRVSAAQAAEAIAERG